MEHDRLNNELLTQKTGLTMQGLFQRYIWLVCQVKEARNGIRFEDINRKWINNSNLNPNREELAKRTFRNWLKAIPEELGVCIECERHAPYKYYISDYGLDSTKMVKWTLEAFSIGNMAIENKSIQERILLEDVPSANAVLTDICRAMRNGHKILMRYHKFGSETDTEFDCLPYAVKLYQNRWYLIAYSEAKKREYTYGIDRIQEIQELDDSFELPEGYSAKEKFDDCIGVYSDEELPTETIKLKVKGYLPNYFDTLPLHHTQEEEMRGEDYVIYRYKLKVNNDLVSRLMTYGSACEALEPQSLRDAMKDALKAALKMYK